MWLTYLGFGVLNLPIWLLMITLVVLVIGSILTFQNKDKPWYRKINRQSFASTMVMVPVDLYIMWLGVLSL